MIGNQSETGKTRKQVLLTGADGFIGEFLKEGLTCRGYQVSGTVFIRLPENENECWLDITRPESFTNLPDQPFDVVIHCAGMVDQSVSSKLMFDVNVGGTRNVVNWARKVGCKHFIQISSSAIYGLKTMGQNRHEDTHGPACRFGADYQRSKAKAEQWVRESGLDYTLLRLPPVIGSGDTIISPAIVSSLKDGTFFMSGKANPLVSVLPISQFPEMVHKVIEHPVTNTAYNCASHHVRWIELVEEYAQNLGIAIPKTTRSWISMLWNIADKAYLLLAVNSRFGSHLPSEKFANEFNFETSSRWTDAVREAVQNYGAGHKAEEQTFGIILTKRGAPAHLHCTQVQVSCGHFGRQDDGGPQNVEKIQSWNQITSSGDE